MSDGLIITGNKTGSPASLSDIKGKHLTCGHILVVPRYTRVKFISKRML